MLMLTWQFAHNIAKFDSICWDFLKENLKNPGNPKKAVHTK